MTHKSLIAVAFFSMTLGACTSAQKASEVEPIEAPLVPYLSLSCKGLAAEQNILYREAEDLRELVDETYSSEKSTEAVSWWLFAPAALFLKGNAEEVGKFAAVKGQLEAIEKAQRANGCLY